MYNNFTVEFTNERIIPSGGLAVVGAILGKSDFVKRMNRMDVTPNRSQHQIKNGDILLTYVGMLQSNGIHPSKIKEGFVPVDSDVSPFDNSKTHKEV